MPKGAPAQQFLDIESIREDIVVMKKGGFRVVLMCSSVNFALKSAEEQDATIYQYQNFLNSLDFPIQIVIHSRKINIDSYLDTLKERQHKETNDLLKVQIAEYSEFVKTFVNMTNIMSKMFYITVPFTPALLEQKGMFGGIIQKFGFGLGGKSEGEAENFEEHKNQLWQRVDTVVSGLQRAGIRSVPLNTEELIELFYGLYNPTEFEQKIHSSEPVV